MSVISFLKWLTLAISAFVLTGCTLFQARVREDIEINAPRKLVWDIIADVENYQSWNPYFINVSFLDEPSSILRTDEIGYRTPILDDSLRIKLSEPDGGQREQEMEVNNVFPGFMLHWSSGLPPLFFGEHRFDLEPTGDCMTRLRHEQRYWGLMVSLMPLGLDSTTEGFQLLNEALKELAESKVDAQANPECQETN